MVPAPVLLVRLLLLVPLWMLMVLVPLVLLLELLLLLLWVRLLRGVQHGADLGHERSILPRELEGLRADDGRLDARLVLVRVLGDLELEEPLVELRASQDVRPLTIHVAHL